MAEYLDKTGLTYFWGKIKAKIPGPLQAYPVGSVYISISSNFNPNTSFGGTWERFGQGRTLIGEGTGNDGSTSMTFTANATGGEYKHKLTVDEIPSHSHKYYSPIVQKVTATSGGETYGNYNKSYLIESSGTGGNGYHNNVQPYITVYFWERTA